MSTYPNQYLDQIVIEINGKNHTIRAKAPTFITYEDVCRLAGYDPALNPSMTCKSPMREKHIIKPDGIGPVELGAVYSVDITGAS